MNRLSDLTVGALVCDPNTTYYGAPIVWQVADKNHTGFPGNSVTLVSERILKVACFDAAEAGNSDSNRQTKGNNRYAVANIRQWLNSDAPAGMWYAAQHSADAPPTSANVYNGWNAYADEAGFLAGFSEKMKTALLETTLIAAKPTVDGGGSETVTDKVFLLSLQEIGLGAENGIAEGTALALFSSDGSFRLRRPTAEAVAHSEYQGSNLNETLNWGWWPRTPNASFSYHIRLIALNGESSNDSAWTTTRGILPTVNIPADTPVSDEPDENGVYTLTMKVPPTAPGSVTAQQGEDGGVTVTWTAATDPKGDALTYRVERSVNGGTWGLAAEETGLVWQDVVGYDWTTVQYRVQAVDDYGLTSDWTTGEAISVVYVLSLVTDRTARDVAQRTKKAFYNASDLIRVESAVAYIAQQLTAYGYPTTLVTKTDWEMGQIPKESQLIRYLNNVKKCLAQYCKQATTPEPPASMANLDYTGANTIEQILLDIDLLLPQMAAVYRPSGTFYAGE